MQTHYLILQSEVNKSYRCTRAANSLDIDQDKKSIHEIKIENCDLESPFSLGLILGASGSGKTTLAKKIWGNDIFKERLNPAEPIINQFPEELSYEDCAKNLAGFGLTSVPCWIRPAYTLSNGQKARAEAALAAACPEEFIVIDEWTSVVDRTVAKVMSHCVSKYAKRLNKKFVLLSCHYDVIEWLDPDWIIDCNTQKFIDRRLLPQSERKRTEQLKFDIKPIRRESWKYFSKYHYLSDRLPGNKLHLFGLFQGKTQIGFQCFANYVAGNQNMLHSNRTVIHPDYAGFGLGIILIDETSKIMTRNGYEIRAKFSSTPVYMAMKKNPLWKLKNVDCKLGTQPKTRISGINNSLRKEVKTYSFEFIWKPEQGFLKK